MILFLFSLAPLDPIAIAHIEELTCSLKSNVTIAIVTHNMQQAGRISDYTAFGYLGELVEFNQTKVIFTKPTNALTEQYITGHFG